MALAVATWVSAAKTLQRSYGFRQKKPTQLCLLLTAPERKHSSVSNFAAVQSHLARIYMVLLRRDLYKQVDMQLVSQTMRDR